MSSNSSLSELSSIEDIDRQQLEVPSTINNELEPEPRKRKRRVGATTDLPKAKRIAKNIGTETANTVVEALQGKALSAEKNRKRGSITTSSVTKSKTIAVQAEELEDKSVPIIIKSKIKSLDKEERLETSTPERKSRKGKVVKKTTAIQKEEAEVENKLPKRKQKRKTKEEKEAEAMPIAVRSAGSRMFVGAHVSAAKGVQNSVTNAVYIAGNAFALFLKSQRKWENPPLQDEHKTQFHAFCKQHNYDASKHVLPHGSYLVNLAHPDPTRHAQAYAAFLDDLQRCEALGIQLFNFHPGNTGPSPRAEAIARIASALNRAHAATSSVKPLLENMAGAGHVVGGTFEDLRDIIAQVTDRSRVGVCLDTCHAFAAGYDLRTPEAFEATLARFDDVVGLRYLCALHLNDSKAPLGSGRDRHQNIGLGFLGLRAFHSVMNEKRFEGLPMILETPIERTGEVWSTGLFGLAMLSAGLFVFSKRDF